MKYWKKRLYSHQLGQEAKCNSVKIICLASVMIYGVATFQRFTCQRLLSWSAYFAFPYPLHNINSVWGCVGMSPGTAGIISWLLSHASPPLPPCPSTALRSMARNSHSHLTENILRTRRLNHSAVCSSGSADKCVIESRFISPVIFHHSLPFHATLPAFLKSPQSVSHDLRWRAKVRCTRWHSSPAPHSRFTLFSKN